MRTFDRHWAKWGRWAAIAAVLTLGALGAVTGVHAFAAAAWTVFGLTLAVSAGYVVAIVRTIRCDRGARRR